MGKERIALGAISLGCSKNRVDTELMLSQLPEAEFVNNPAEAEVIIVNTCGFIEQAKQESIDAILEMAEYKKQGKLRGLIVTGCLSERYRQELSDELPEVDAFLGVHAYAQIAETIEHVLRRERVISYDAAGCPADYAKRVLTTPPYQAYIRIADGCSNRCAYCAIPMIRGPFVSRPIEEIEEEVRSLAARGVKEFILVAQDTTKYGIDLYLRQALPELIDRLAPIEGVTWLRVLYCYPESVTPKLISAMMRYDNVAKYIDIPIQHFDNGVLKRMRRANTNETTRNVVSMIREASPDFIIRTTLIAGFPGESEEAFGNLKNGVSELCFDRLGVFAYSQEEGTPAAAFPEQLPDALKQARAEEIMKLQEDISRASNARRVGRTYQAVVEKKAPGGYFARTQEQAPEIDGKLFITTNETLIPGEFYTVRITSAEEYDLYGDVEG